MTGREDSSPVTTTISWLLIAMGVTVLAGWLFSIDALKGGVTGFSTMKPGAASCFVLTGLALLLLARHRHDPSRRRRVRGLALLIAAVAAFVLAATARVLVTGIAPAPAGWMSPYAALNFLLISGALLCVASPDQGRRARGQLLSLAVSLTGLVWIIDYLLRVDALFTLGGANGMSVPGALAFPSISAACVCLDCESATSVVLGRRPGSVMLRRLLPAALGGPIMIAWIWKALVQSEIVSAHLATALTSVAYIGILGLLVLVTAYSLNRVDAEREHVTAEMLASRSKLAAIIDATDDAVISKDRDGTVLTWNGGAERIFGYRADEIVGRSIALLIPEERRTEEEFILTQLASGQQLKGYEAKRRRKDGVLIDVALTVSPIRDQHARIVGAANISRDITDRKHAETALENMAAVLEQRVAERTAELTAANQELEAFAYAVAHDLRAPLRAMTGFSQAIIEDHAAALPSEARAYLDQIVIGGRHMGELIDGLLVLSRCTRGELQRDTIDITALANRIRDELDRDDPKRQIMWNIERGLRIYGDARMFEVVMRTLLSNAWKFTARTPQPSIRVYAEGRAPHASICVSDNGAGFDMKHADKLFRPFQRLHRQEEFPGTGVGLATAQRIVHRHGGTMQASASVGAGATFSFELPSQPIALEAA